MNVYQTENKDQSVSSPASSAIPLTVWERENGKPTLLYLSDGSRMPIQGIITGSQSEAKQGDVTPLSA